MKHFQEHPNSLEASIKFDSFKQCLDFVVQVGELAERENHHPDIDIRYDELRLKLSTHDAGNKVTEKDISLAQKIEMLYENFLLS